jgi:hypothetical protein
MNKRYCKEGEEKSLTRLIKPKSERERKYYKTVTGASVARKKMR